MLIVIGIELSNPIERIYRPNEALVNTLFSSFFCSQPTFVKRTSCGPQSSLHTTAVAISQCILEELKEEAIRLYDQHHPDNPSRREQLTMLLSMLHLVMQACNHRDPDWMERYFRTTLNPPVRHVIPLVYSMLTAALEVNESTGLTGAADTTTPSIIKLSK